MLSFKEILILGLALIGSLIIALSIQGQPSPENNPPVYSEIQSDSSLIANNQDIWASQEIQNIPASPCPIEKTSQIELASTSILSLKETISETILPETKNMASQQAPSLEEVLTEVENLSSELKSEFEQIQTQNKNCSTCGQTENASPCATVLAQLGGGICNCATLGCTPWYGPWCVHPCCCVCCPVCCR